MLLPNKIYTIIKYFTLAKMQKTNFYNNRYATTTKNLRTKLQTRYCTVSHLKKDREDKRLLTQTFFKREKIIRQNRS